MNEPESVMTLSIAGGTVMVLSIVLVIGLLSFCLYKVFTLPPVE